MPQRRRRAVASLRGYPLLSVWFAPGAVRRFGSGEPWRLELTANQGYCGGLVWEEGVGGRRQLKHATKHVSAHLLGCYKLIKHLVRPWKNG